MSKIALITDLHLGTRKDNPIIYENMRSFYCDLFFPTLRKRNIKYIINLGDTLDRRNSVDLNLLQRCKEDFLYQLEDFISYFLIGNHDTYFKSNIDTNSIRSCFAEYETVIEVSKPKDIYLYDECLALVPWITQSNYDDCMNFMKNTSANYCFGHFEIKGFEFFTGTYAKHGLSSELFSNFSHVYSGHYHKKSTQSNITYLGSPYQTTWNEYPETKGFHIFDTKTGELEFIENPNRLFYLLNYPEDFDMINTNVYDSKYVKIIVTEQNSKEPDFQTKYDQIKQLAANLTLKVTEKLMESYNPLDDKTDNISIASIETIGHDYIDVLEHDRKNELKELFTELYNRAKEIADNQIT